MTAADQLLAECVERPGDDAPRLVWADAIGGDRGELVGLQCGRTGLVTDQLATRNRRERELIATHAMAWSGLAGLARRVRFRRGFVEAIEVDASTFLDKGEQILARAPLVSALTVTGIHPPYRTPQGRDEARARLGSLLASPAFARIRALDLVDQISERDDSGADGAAQVIATSGVLGQLTALGVRGLGADGCVALAGGQPTALERLWLRDSVIGSEWLGALLEAAPRLSALDLRPTQFDVIARHLPRLTELVVRGTDGLAQLAATPLADTITRLAFMPIDWRGQLAIEELPSLARFRKLRSLELRGDVLTSEPALRTLAAVELPALRELRLGWTGSRAGIEAVLARFGPQLELVDLRAALRFRRDDLAGDVLVDEPRELELLHGGEVERAEWRSHPDVDHPGGPIPPAWIVGERGVDPARVWELGHLGDRPIRIGRASSGDIPLFDGSVARVHAVLRWQDGAHVVRDMRSTNGTLVDGVPIEADMRLHHGAQLTLGHIRLRYFVGTAGGAEATAHARWVETHDPLTGLARHAPPSAARIRLANRDEIMRRSGGVAVDRVLGELARRLREAAGPGVTLAAPAFGDLAVDPASHAQALVAAIVARPIEIDGADVEIRVEVIPPAAVL